MNNRAVESINVDVTKRSFNMMAWIICALGALFYCYEYLLRIAPSVMSTDLMSSYHLTATQFGNLTAFYYYAYMPMQIVVGIFMDRYGPRLLVTLACLSCAVGTYLFACSDILFIAEIGRFMVGFGSAFAYVGALKLATIWLPPNRFALVAGIVTALGNVGAMTGDMLLTSLVQNQGWRQTSMMTAILGIGLAVLIVLIVRDNSKEAAGKHLEIDYPRVFSGLLQALKRRQIWFNGLVGGLIYIPTTAFAELWGIPYLEQARGFTSHQAAATVSMIFLGWVIGCPLVGFISDYIRRRILPMIIGCVVAFVTVCYIIYTPNISVHMMMAIFFVLGVSGCVQMLVFAVGRESSAPHIAGTAIALTNAFVMLGGVIFQPVIGFFLDQHWTGGMAGGVRVYDAHDFQMALVVLPIGMVISFFLLLMMRETKCELLEE